MKKKIHWVITTTSTDTEIKTTPNASWSLDTEILTHRTFVKLRYDKIYAFTIRCDFHPNAVRQCIRIRPTLSLSLSLSLSKKKKSQNTTLPYLLRFKVTLPCREVAFAGKTEAMPFWYCKTYSGSVKLFVQFILTELTFVNVQKSLYFFARGLMAGTFHRQILKNCVYEPWNVPSMLMKS